MMEKVSCYAAVVGCHVLVAICVSAAPPPPEAARSYFNFDVGANFMNDQHVKFETGPVAGLAGDAKMELGFRVGLAEEIAFNRFLSAQVETGFLYNEWKDADVWYGQIPILADLIFKYDFDSGWTPFIGAGGGGVVSLFDVSGSGTDADFVFGWQGLAGLRYRFSDNFGLGVIYKYLGTSASKFNVDDIKFKVSDIHNHYVGLQLNYAF